MIILEPIRKSLWVDTSPARAFEVFSARMSSWWPPTHSILKSPLKQCIVEPWVGGRWYSTGEDGSSCDIGRVLVWQPPERLVLSWQITPDWAIDPDLVTEVDVRFTAADGGAQIDLEHPHLERMGGKAAVARAAVDAPNGWAAILGSFKKAAEHAE